ncbi:MAG TPA: glucose PTS transporter subunit IIA [Cellulomonas sp.]
MSDRALTDQLVGLLGGADNIVSAAHCMTRIRLELRDRGAADLTAAAALPGVLGARQQGAETQIVIGNDVPRVFAAFEQSRAAAIGAAGAGSGAGPAGGAGAATADRPARNDLFGQFLGWLSGIFFPVVPALAGSGLIKTVLSILTNVGWMSTDSQEYQILYLISNVVLYFLPFMLAVSTAKKCGTSMYTALCLAGALMYPTITAAIAAGTTSWSLFGLPIRLVDYSSTVIPIVVTVWLTGYLERWLERKLPAVLRVMCLVGLVLLIAVPIELSIIGPAGSYLGEAIASGISWLFSHTSVFAGVLLGALQGPMVLTGTHLTEIPLIVQELAANGGTVIMPVTMMANMALAGGLLAVALKWRRSGQAPLYWSVMISGLAGITEPGLYGVAIKFRRVFYASIVGGGLGGGIVAYSGFLQPVVASLGVFSPALFTTADHFWGYLVGTLVAIGSTFVLTLLWLPAEDGVPADVDAAAASVPGSGSTAVVSVQAPCAGRVVALSEVGDPVFAAGTLGQGVGFIPTGDVLRAPVSGTIVAVPATGHAIGLRTDDGTELLLHIGIDTVRAGGAGFSVLVDEEDRIEAGEALVQIDRAALAAAGFSGDALVSPIVVTNRADAELRFAATGPVEAGAELFSLPVALEVVTR